MHAECSMLPSEIVQIIVSCVENAVGDDIRSDIRVYLKSQKQRNVQEKDTNKW